MKKTKDFIIKSLASGLGLGYIPKAPGTCGTLLGIPLFYALHNLSPIIYMGFTLIFIIFAILISELAVRIYNEEDPQRIVIDEIAGFLVTMTWLPLTWQSLLAGFILFRILDALKPGPIGYIDRKVKGGLGVVIDDVAAGILANVILQILYTQTSLLGLKLS